MRDLLVYLADQVLDGSITEIHEQEVGHRIFGRPLDYDTANDNIVRVHASMLRKRLQQYFSVEGAEEPLVIEIPKGNYALVFKTRPAEPLPTDDSKEGAPEPTLRPSANWRLGALAGLALLFACTTIYLLVRERPLVAAKASEAGSRPTVNLLWSHVFQPDRPTDIVLDDAAVGLYQELTGKPLALSNYYDRGYLRSLAETAEAAKLDPQSASAIVLRRQSSYSGASVLWKLFQLADGRRSTVLRFARDYSFRELKANNAVLLGNRRSNPWMEPFDSKLGLRWAFDPATSTYYPVDTWASNRKYQPADPSESREGYCAISLVPNLGETGSILMITATGGSASNAGADFLADEQSVALLRSKLPSTKDRQFPYFELLLSVKGRGSPAKEATIEVCRSPRGL